MCQHGVGERRGGPGAHLGLAVSGAAGGKWRRLASVKASFGGTSWEARSRGSSALGSFTYVFVSPSPRAGPDLGVAYIKTTY